MQLVSMVYLRLQKKLHTLTLESERLKSEIASRQELLSRIDSETEVVDVVGWFFLRLYLI